MDSRPLVRLRFILKHRFQPLMLTHVERMAAGLEDLSAKGALVGALLLER